jgi:hypothetical protein
MQPVVAGITGPGDTAPYFCQNFTKKEIANRVDKKTFCRSADSNLECESKNAADLIAHYEKTANVIVI